ncbi:MAG: glutamate ligase domain-containing protein, partial [Dehalococcoidia bacterium]
IGLTHVSKLGAPDAIEREKLSLVRYLGPESTAILNLDDPRLARATGTLSCRVLTFGSKATGAELTWTNARDQGLEGIRFDVRRGTGDWLDARSPLIGVHTLPAALTALAAGLVFGLDLPEAVAALAAGSIPGRLRVLAGLRGSTLLDDTYNSSPASLAGALNTLDSVRGEGTGRRLALLGPMAELGDFERQAHLEAGRVAAEYCDILVAVGEPCRALVEEAKASGLADTLWCDSKEEAARRLAGMVESDDVVLLKASRSTALETIVPVLAEGGAA